MANRVFVDTSFVLALINERDQFHKQAEALSFNNEFDELAEFYDQQRLDDDFVSFYERQQWGQEVYP